ncbi:MAG: carbamoyltransferase HypF [Anaerolineaceae bacterium]|nr:carbamoyltransferase HypF [Anaerolineaceae bacterium]
MANTINGLQVNIRGIVQGVGFRPFVYGLAIEHNLTGWVRNTSSGVEIEVDGAQPDLETFLRDLRDKMPPLAKIDEIQSEFIASNGFEGFKILSSQPKPGEFIPISPDVTICDDCARELFDPSDRRYRYPFINCTNCGPRYTIIQDIPYDRPKTTMSGFPMCADCHVEYENPLDRRFHAQPVACDLCGPQIWYEEQGEVLGHKEDALTLARQALKDGKILAVKGLGGFHLACDASNSQAVQTLRDRKKRSDKPFALMAFSLEQIKQHCEISTEEEALLQSRQRPIVLLDRKPGSTICDQVAPRQNTLGFMLPYTPLHLLLLEPAPDFPEAFVMTSGNLSEEPIAYEDNDAYQRLDLLVDGFLMHNRPIHIRVDDSVARVLNGEYYPIRRSRGYAPDAISFDRNLPSILAAGGELKNTFCLSRDRYAFLSHHIGDLENYETEKSFEEGIEHFQKLFRITPQAIACDMHPSYLASRYARVRAQKDQLPLIEIQHHHAHLAAVLADNHIDSDEPVLGVIFDGTGYGTDGHIWGGEFLLGNYKGYERLYHLDDVSQPGGDLATRNPSRMALSHLWHAGLDWDLIFPPTDALCSSDRQILRNQLERQINCPQTSSMGRFFDAASSLIGIRQTVNYEGQAAIEMEAITDPDESGFYPFELDPSKGIIQLRHFWEALIADLSAGVSQSILAARFHNSIMELVLKIARQTRTERAIHTIALSGGVWQNLYLYEQTVKRLKNESFEVLVHHQVPTNDGGIALGQLMIAASVLELNGTN